MENHGKIMEFYYIIILYYYIINGSKGQRPVTVPKRVYSHFYQI